MTSFIIIFFSNGFYHAFGKINFNGAIKTAGNEAGRWKEEKNKGRWDEDEGIDVIYLRSQRKISNSSKHIKEI